MNFIFFYLSFLFVSLQLAVDSKQCSFRNFCPPNSRCRLLRCGGYTCDCVKWWTGNTCEEAKVARVSACIPNPCGNRGKCEATSNGFRCNCLREYSGLACRTKKSTVERLLSEFESSDDYKMFLDSLPADSSTPDNVTVTFSPSFYEKWNMATESDFTYQFSQHEFRLHKSNAVVAMHWVSNEYKQHSSFGVKVNFPEPFSAGIQMVEHLEKTTVFMQASTKSGMQVVNFAIGDTTIVNEESVLFHHNLPSRSKTNSFEVLLRNWPNNILLGTIYYRSNVTSKLIPSLLQSLSNQLSFTSLFTESNTQDLNHVNALMRDVTSSIQENEVENEETTLPQSNTKQIHGFGYTNGNLIQIDGMETIHHGQTYLQSSFELATSNEQSFVLLMWISNVKRKQEKFAFKVISSFPTTGGEIISGENEVSGGKFVIKYKYFKSTENKLSHVYFLMYSKTGPKLNIWSSSPNPTLNVTNISDVTTNFSHRIEISGKPRSVLAGYFEFRLLKTSSEIDEVNLMQKYLEMTKQRKSFCA